MFPGAGARVDYNEAGEPVSWDYPAYDDLDEPPYADHYEDDGEEYDEEEDDES